MVEENPALARKRRIEQRRAGQRPSDIEVSDGSEGKRARVDQVDEDDISSESDDVSSRAVPSIRGIKRQARYEPGVPMTKEELQKWRKQARRVRNRESAAASRLKTRERITELESEVSDLQLELAKARARIAELESGSQPTSSSLLTPKVETDERPLSPTVSSPVTAPQVSPVPSPTASPMSSPKSLLQHESFSLDSSAPSVPLPSMISRPTAD